MQHTSYFYATHKIFLYTQIQNTFRCADLEWVHVGAHPDEGGEEPEGGCEEPLDQRREEDQREGDADDGVHDARSLARVGQRVDVAVTCRSGTECVNIHDC